ncbi:Putative ribonuclease H protein At1g65750 [Linum perenne]
MNCRSSQTSSRSVVDVGWKSAIEGWITLNSDRSVVRNPSSAAAGWVVHETDDRAQAAGSINLKRCTITRAEMRDVVEGMQVAWDLGVRRMEVQMDSSVALRILLGGSLNNKHASLV